MNYIGVIIEESLGDKSILQAVKILSTRVEKTTTEHATPWLSQWTLHTVEIPEDKAMEVAETVSRALEPAHAWYADFKSDTHHYIIFRDKVFYINRTSREQYDEAGRYGLSLGIPERQLINYEGEYSDAVGENAKNT